MLSFKLSIHPTKKVIDPKFFVVKKYLSSRKHIFDATVEMMSIEVCFFV